MNTKTILLLFIVGAVLLDTFCHAGPVDDSSPDKSDDDSSKSTDYSKSKSLDETGKSLTDETTATLPPVPEPEPE